MPNFLAMERLQHLRQQIEATESQLRQLKSELRKAELEVEAPRQNEQSYHSNLSTGPADEAWSRLQSINPDGGKAKNMPKNGATNGEAPQPIGSEWPLAGEEYTRYGRQMIMPEIGLQGQLQLKHAKVLIVGVGGLGCPAAAYLAGAGIGTLGLMDGDKVEISNMHRQIAHATARLGMSKVDSAFEYLQSLNPRVRYNRHSFHLSPNKAVATFEQYDLVLDCTDHPTSRYLISDACVLAGRPLISASALKTEGQLIILNNPPRRAGDTSGGPCYRCIFPKPPPAESILSCGEGGIIGPVVGVMGVLQALEALKLLTTKPKVHNEDVFVAKDNASKLEPVKPSMLMFSAFSNPQFRTVRLRSRRLNCASCSAQASITEQALTSGSLDYIAFCGVTTPINILPPHLRISAGEYGRLRKGDSDMLIDVRDETQYAICALPGSINVPWTGSAESWLEKAKNSNVMDDKSRQTYIVCRFGNDSQLAAKAVMDSATTPIEVKDVKGGFKSWRQEVDHDWPDY